MKNSRIIIAAAMLALAGVAAHSADKVDKRTAKNEAKLEKMLEGRTAGTPVSCISQMQSNHLQVIEGVALVYDAGDTIYVARPTDPSTLRRDDVIVINRFGGQFCNTDVIRTVDRSGGFFTGVVFLKEFVPYRKQN